MMIKNLIYSDRVHGDGVQITLVRVTAAIVAAPRRRRRLDRKEVVIVISGGPEYIRKRSYTLSSAHTNTFDVAAGHCTRIT